MFRSSTSVRLVTGVVLGAALGCVALAAQPQPAPASPPPGAIASAAVEPSDDVFTLTYFNRPIVVFRARVLGRRPAERAELATRVLDRLAADRTTGPIESRTLEGASLISVGSQVILALTPLDVGDLANETLEGISAQTVARLQQALNEAVEARQPGALLRATALGGAALAVGLLLLWGIGRARKVAASRLATISERTVSKSGLADVHALRASRLLDFQRGLVSAVAIALQLLVAYSVITIILRRFPYTRPWGDSLRGFLFTTVLDLTLGVANAVPGLFTVVLIFLIARVATRLLALWFNSVERGHIKTRWIYPETALPTRRLASTLLWIFAVVVAYPYLPGSQTDAFKGVSVFLGLILTFGSSGLVNQIMSGFMVTYSRALRVGDYVRIGDVEGTVIHLGVLSTKIKTLQREEVTIPNGVVVSTTTTDYSRFADTEGVFTTTSVTIGYDAPWRQVHALLLEAAQRTTGLRREPKSCVMQSSLDDFYVKYTLYVSLEHQESRLVTMDALYANIQDLFNEYGVQIMSPNYVFDPAAPKVVAKKDWFAAPARPD